jgi:hypothetical protein
VCTDGSRRVDDGGLSLVVNASQRQVKDGCRHRQAWVMDRGCCGPDPGERVSVEGGALEPGSGRCTVDPGAQTDKDEHDRGGTRTLRLRSRVTLCTGAQSVDNWE